MALAVLSGLSNCTSAVIDAGCIADAESRLSMPRDPEVLPDHWLEWLAVRDARMEATCK